MRTPSSSVAWASLLLAIFATYAYFFAGPGWNQNSRFALTRALVEHHGIAIDASHATTGDKARRDGHYYSDKAPGTSWLAIVPYAGVWLTRGGRPPSIGWKSIDPDAPVVWDDLPEVLAAGDRWVYGGGFRIGLYVCTLFAVGLPSVVASGTLAWFLRADGATSRSDTALSVLAYALATPAMVYSTAFYGHQLAAAACWIGFALVLGLRQPTPRWAWLVGTVWGLSVVTEYPTAPLVLFGWGWSAMRHSKRFAFHVALGGVPWALALGLYHHAAFGAPWSTGYDHLVDPRFADGMSVAYGLSWPRLDHALALTFGSYRGLFYVSPVLLLGAWGLVFDAWTRREATAIAGVVIVAYQLALNAGYFAWDGGAAAGPRHLIVALPWLALGFPRALRASRGVFGVLLVVSAASILLLTAAGPEAPQSGDPLWEYAIPNAIGLSPEVADRTLGGWLGLRPPWTLVPPVALWVWALYQWLALRVLDLAPDDPELR